MDLNIARKRVLRLSFWGISWIQGQTALSEDGATPWPNSDLHKDVSVKNWTEKLMRAKRSAMNSWWLPAVNYGRKCCKSNFSQHFLCLGLRLLTPQIMEQEGKCCGLSLASHNLKPGLDTGSTEYIWVLDFFHQVFIRFISFDWTNFGLSSLCVGKVFANMVSFSM